MKIAIYNRGIVYDGNTPFVKPLGGSESGVVYMARELARLGHTVSVYCNCPEPGDFDGVTYIHYHRFFDHYRYAPWDVFVAFRSFDPLLIGRIAPKVIFWTGDDCFQPTLEHLGHDTIQNNVDLIFCVSDWHRRMLADYFKLNPDKVIATRNGFNPDLVPPAREKRWTSGTYCSTPFRGLEILLKSLFPAIHERIPEMTLDVFSSMKVYQISVEVDRAEHGGIYELAEQPGVNWHGSVSQTELLGQIADKGFLLYPNTFDETSCIAAIEAQASGQVVITSAKAGLNETVENGVTGICLPGEPKSESYQREFVETVCELLRQPERLMELSRNARERAFRMYTWGAIAAEWTSIMEDMTPVQVTGRYTGPLCLLEKTYAYLNSGNVNAAKRVLSEIDRTPFLKHEAQTLRQSCGL